MTLTEAKRIADRPKQFELDMLRAARDRLARTRRNGGVRNSESASERLERRIARLDEHIAVEDGLQSMAGGGPG